MKGGWFVGFLDGRFDIYRDAALQHIAADGSPAPGWPADGIIIARGNRGQFVAGLVPDDSGGVIVGIQDDSSNPGDLYLQRFTSAGTIAPGWPTGGLPIAMGPATQQDLQLIRDGHGGVYAGWNVIPDFFGNDTAYVQHITGSGVVSPGWPADGRRLSPGMPESFFGGLLEDGGGGVFVGWGVDAHAQCDSTALLAQHFLGDGSIALGWPIGGQVMKMDVGVRNVSELASDGTGGLYAIWGDLPSCSASVFAEDVYAQHVLANGMVAPGWPAKGLPVCTLPETQQDSRICSDGAGGFFAAWEDYRSGIGQVYVERVTSLGQPAPGWAVAGQPISTLPGYTIQERLTPDGLGGLYIAFEQYDGHYHAYCQHVTAAGTLAPGWLPTGALLADVSSDSDQQDVAGTTDGAGGIVVAWDDTRNGVDADVYAQRLELDGPVAVDVSLVKAEASVGHVDLEWLTSGVGPLAVQRRELGAPWIVLGSTSPDGAGHVVWTDSEVNAGHRYAYRLTWTSSTGQQTSPEVWVDVPTGYRLELAGFTPNPATSVPRVTFTLPDASPARVQVLDVTGRMVLDADVASLGPGRHTIAIDRDLAPGLYWLRLNSAGHELRTRGAVIR
ncbi:MAG TPA: hypothetical protein VFK69_06110 [Candidatus Eisenbacteria bacterium]|nr:hypothetical protein [Candidatus Eisenbacteria bacterium]